MSGQSITTLPPVSPDAPSSPPDPVWSFETYASAGFGEDLLPIIPPGVEIHPDSDQLASLTFNRGKVPGEKRGRYWVGKHKFTASVATADDHRRWQASGAGIGMLGRNFPALDIDIDNEQLAEAVYELAVAILGDAPVRFGRGSRRVLVFRGAGFSKRRIAFRALHAPAPEPGTKETLQAVEFLATGQQYVVEGIHPKTLKPYTWLNERSPVAIGPGGLTPITPDALDAFYDQLERLLDLFECQVVNRSRSGSHELTVYQDGLLGPSVAAIGRALAAIPNEVDYDTWLKIGVACKAAAGPDREADAYALFEDWSLSYPENTPELVLAKWQSFRSPYKIGWDFLARFAQDEGDGSFFSAHEDFDAVADAPGHDARSGPLLPPAEQNMFDRYVWVESIQRICDRLTGDLLNREQFNVRLANIGDPTSTKECAWAVFVGNYVNMTAVRNVTYRPGQGQFVTEALPGLTGRSINTWTDPAVALPSYASDVDIKPWLDHVAMVIPDEFERETVLSWLAWICQNPGEKPNWALVIGSTSEGLGKDLMMDPVRTALGSGNVREIGPDDLSSGWTDFLKGTRLLIIEEMELNERKATMNRLKPLIAAPPYTLRVNIKFQPQYEVPNLVAAVFFTNMQNALAVSSEGRRYFVTWNDAKPREAEYYEQLVGWYASGGAAKAARWLMDRDVSSFKAKGRAPDTKAKENMRLETRSLLDELIEDGLADQTGPFAHRLFALKEVLVWLLGKLGDRNGISPRRVCRALKAAGAVQIGRFALGDEPAGCSVACSLAREEQVFARPDLQGVGNFDGDTVRAMFWTDRSDFPVSAATADAIFSGDYR